jgi:uncharacterized protein
MSELINNHEQRREILKELIKDLHNGKDPEVVKAQFKELIKDINPKEISLMEQELINEGLPQEEIKKLCDVHVSIFKEDLDQRTLEETDAGHPIQTFKKENRALEGIVGDIRSLLKEITDKPSQEEIPDLVNSWKELHQKLWEVEKHYSRKENILFPYLEKHNISGPSSVMWAIHDDIRDDLKKISKSLEESQGLTSEKIAGIIEATVYPTLTAIEEMIYKEENILFPMSLETLSEEEWSAIYQQSSDIGYTLITPESGWTIKTGPEEEQLANNKELRFPTGNLSYEEIELILNNLPIDITFVDKEDRVKYFSHGKERIFERTKAIIGRKVQNCHPPDSVHVVNKIVEEFKEGKRDSADFWLEMQGMFVYIRYFPIRNALGEYLGTIEITQNVKSIRDLQGEKRILDD